MINTRLSLTRTACLGGQDDVGETARPGVRVLEVELRGVGLLVERLRGQPIGDVISEQITGPLGMTGTFMIGARTPPSGIVHGYLVIEDQRVDVTLPRQFVTGSPSGGLVSTVQDLNTFYSALCRESS